MIQQINESVANLNINDYRALVFVNVCSRRNPEWDMYISLHNAMSHAAQKGVYCQLVPSIGGTLICRERNRATREFMKTQFTHLLTLDDDVALQEDAIVKLVSANKPIIGGTYRLKDMSAARCANRIKNTHLWPMILKGGIIHEAIYISSGCMLVQRHVLQDMMNKYQDLKYEENISGDDTYALYQPFIYQHESGIREYLSEDWAFCERARKVGWQSYVHGGVKCGHWGLYKFDFYFPKDFIDRLPRSYDLNVLDKIELEDKDLEEMQEDAI